MTEITQYQDPSTTAVEVQQPSVTRSLIRQTALELADAHQIATAICGTAFVPKHFRDKPDETAVAILYGATVGFDPITAVQQVYEIGGKPALYARAMVGIVLAAGHEIWIEDETPGSVTVAGRRKGSEKVTRVTWTSELAKQAGYDKNPKYRTDPRSMLYARASGDVARRIAPDALMGMAYNVEELEIATPTQVSAQREPATGSAVRDRVQAAIAPTPAPAAEPAQEARSHESGWDSRNAAQEPPQETAAADTITEAQNKKLHALVGELGLDRDQKLGGCTAITGREITTTSDLTKAEAAAVIDSLEARAQAASATPAEDVHDAEIVTTAPERDPERDQLWAKVVAVATQNGITLWDLESMLKEECSATPDTATADDIRTIGRMISSLPAGQAVSA